MTGHNKPRQLLASLLPHCPTAQEQSCEQAELLPAAIAHSGCSRSLALDPSEIPGVPITTRRRELCIWYSAVPVFENRLSLRIHIFSALVIMGTNVFLSQQQKIWCCLEGLLLAVPRSTAMC